MKKLEARMKLMELEIETLKRMIKVNAAEINKQRPRLDGKPEGK